LALAQKASGLPAQTLYRPLEKVVEVVEAVPLLADMQVVLYTEHRID
jgi:hypothetical protein